MDRQVLHLPLKLNWTVFYTALGKVTTKGERIKAKGERMKVLSAEF
jgi:hypothetical protein